MNDQSSLVLVVTGPRGQKTHTLDAERYTIGRAQDCDISIPAAAVSGHHAELVRESGSYRFVQTGRTNPTFLNGVVLSQHLLRPGDLLEIAPGTPDAVTLQFDSPMATGGETLVGVPSRTPLEADPMSSDRVAVPTGGSLTIGRSTASDLVLPNLLVSREHAVLTSHDGAISVNDLGSANGTYVNGVRITHHALAAGDVVRIGPYKLAVADGAVERVDDSKQVRLDAYDVFKQVGNKVLLDHISFDALPGEVLAIAGTSGAGKSTLLDALNGMRPPTSGRILVNGTDLYRAYDALRPLIGYVPQESILPEQLPVRRALRYTADLRLPPDVGASEAEERVDAVMRQLDLTARSDVRIGNLSGGQQKRASIAAELIADPGLFFLDEPTSGLDPGLTRRVTHIVRGLANNGATIVMISHDIESLSAADKILMLGSGGRVVFFGRPDDAVAHFEVDELAEIYDRVEAEDSTVWRDRFEHSRFYQGPQTTQPPDGTGEDSGARGQERFDPAALISGRVREGASIWRQLRIATTRYVDQMVRDRAYLMLLLAQAPIIAVLISIVATSGDLQPPSALSVFQAALFGIPAAELARPLALMMCATATWFGAINAAREIVKELPIWVRERMAGLRLAPYLASKCLLLSLVCLVQVTVLLGIVAIGVEFPSSGPITWGPLELWITLNLASFAALGLGLLLSASVSNTDRAQSLVPIILIPQLIFIGGPSTPTLGQWLSYLTVTHWSVEAMKITAAIPYKEEPGGFGTMDLVGRWAALVVMALVLLTLAAVQMARRRSA